MLRKWEGPGRWWPLVVAGFLVANVIVMRRLVNIKV